MRRRNRIRALLVCAATVALATILLRAPAGADDAALRNGPMQRTPVAVVELFTSQGCSSCPPADALLSRIGREKRSDGIVIPLAFHVDYWNRLGWTDAFSSREWSNRQSRYAAIRDTSTIYTPQVVLNGSARMVGSNEKQVRAEIARRLEKPLPGLVSIDHVRCSDDTLSVDISAELAGRSEQADVFLIVFENDVLTAVTRGENRGRRLTNDYIVRSMTRAFQLRGGDPTRSGTLEVRLDPGWRRDHSGVVAVMQNPESLEILGSSRPATLEQPREASSKPSRKGHLWPA